MFGHAVISLIQADGNMKEDCKAVVCRCTSHRRDTFPITPAREPHTCENGQITRELFSRVPRGLESKPRLPPEDVSLQFQNVAEAGS